MDSVVLLHALRQLQDREEKSLLAVHVHHGLMADADAWTAHCESLCRQLDVPLEVVRVAVDPRDEGLEAAARKVRYAVLRRYVQADTALLTAHHQDDQAETVLLHLLKGAGTSGLAGMPLAKPFGRGWHFRPLLRVGRDRIRSYAEQYQLSFVEDPSNLDTRHERNFLRHRIIPALQSRWPKAVSGIARAASHQAEQKRLAADLAAQDLQQVAETDGSLSIPRLRQLAVARQKNCLRYWLRQWGGEDANPTTIQLASLMTELMDAARDAEPEFRLGSKVIHRYRDRLYQLPAGEEPPLPDEYIWQLDAPLRIPPLGIRIEPWSVLAIYPHLSAEDQLTVRFRCGGEKIRDPGTGRHHSLKKRFQEWGVPPWRRDLVPLVYQGQELLVVWGYACAVPASNGG